jgi:hypothetical protein
MWCVLFIEISMKYNFPISILFFLPFAETLIWSQVSGCLCQTFHHAGVCSCRGGTQGLLPQLGKSWELLGTPKSFKIYFTLDAKRSKRSKRFQKHFRVSGCLPGDFVHKVILIWTINREPPPPTGSIPKRQADCAVRHLNQAVTIRQKSKVISNHYIQIPQIAGGWWFQACVMFP